MQLLVRIVLAIFLIACTSLAGAAVWVMLETGRLIDREAQASADRVVREAQALAWKELTWRGSEGRYAKYAFPDWRSSDTLKMIAPGHCVSLGWTGEATLRTCSGSAGIGMSAPNWFEAVYEILAGKPQSVKRTIILNRKPAGEVVATPEWQATTARAWQQFGIVFVVAAALVGCISFLSGAIIGYALYPAAVIIGALKRLEAGDYSSSIPPVRSAEFGLIARAVNDLKDRLLKSTAVRAELTKKLFMAREVERIALARDLHDEFGQCLTATAALASAIATSSRHARPEAAEDAKSIMTNVARMMGSLKGCIARLRPPEIEELGLIASLSTLVTRWNSQNSGCTTYRLDVGEEFSGLDTDVAVCIYRIAQESLTNASKHGHPSHVSVSLNRTQERGARYGSLELVVEDDGGGHPEDVQSVSGHGITGIRERVSALGGDLVIGAGKAGLRILARIPSRWDFEGQAT